MAASTTTKRMTQTEIISQLADKAGMKKAEAKEFFTALAALATSEVKKKWRVHASRLRKIGQSHAQSARRS